MLFMFSLCSKMFHKWCLFVIEIFHSSLLTMRFSVFVAMKVYIDDLVLFLSHLDDN